MATWFRTVYLTLFVVVLASSASAQSNDLVDRFSVRIDEALAGDAGDESYRDLNGGQANDREALVTGLRWGEGESVEITVKMKAEGPRLLLIDTGVVIIEPVSGAAYVPVPFQRFILQKPETFLSIEVLPIRAQSQTPLKGTPLKAVWSNDPGLIAVLRIAHKIEAVDSQRLMRYVKQQPDGTFAVNTFLDNQDVTLARSMTWSKNIADRLEGKLPRNPLRFAILAVTEGQTVQNVADWYRVNENLDMQPAVDKAFKVSKQIEYLLDRASLNFRLFSPRYADYHFNVGIAAYERDDLPAAMKAFSKAMELNPDMVEAKYNLGIVQYRSGDYQKAAGTFLIASGMKGASANVFFNRGATLYRTGNKLGAARAMRKVLALNERDPDAKRWLELADPDGKTKPRAKRKKKRRKRRRRRRRRK